MKRQEISNKERRKKEDSENPDKLHFEVDAGLLIQLGEQLVARRSVALSELIKNAYDADATVVTVLLENVTKEHGTIIVEDNGTGMTFEEICDYWMRIATTDKLRNPISPIYGRSRTGAKGIGRFAARRLANKLTVHSVAQREDGFKEETVVKLDWHKKFKPGATLRKIPVDYDRQVVDNSTPTGVTLYLENARDIWSADDITDLRRDLLSLVNPFPVKSMQGDLTGETSDPGFLLELEVPEFPKYDGELGKQFLAASWAVLEGKIDNQGIPKYKLEIRVTGEHLEFSPEGEVFPGLTNVHFTTHFFSYKKELFTAFEFGTRDAQKMGREQGGIRVYLDGFRVFPYGDPGDDWLGLDEARAGRVHRSLFEPTQELRGMESVVPGRPWLLLPGNNQLFGAVEISREHKGIEINVSRERLLENETFDNLRRFILLGIYWMTIQYARVRSDEVAKQRLHDSPTALDLIERARSQVLAMENIAPEVQREVIGILEYAQERAKVEQEVFISELAMLRVLSSLGATIAMFNHQLIAIIDGIRAIYTDLQELRPYVLKEKISRYDRILGQIETWHTLLKTQVSQLGSLLGKRKRERRQRLNLRSIVDKVTNPLSLYRQEFGIEFSNKIPNGMRTPPIYEAELHAVILHIFTNALKAVRDQEIRKIEARARREKDGLHFFMLDTGKGVEPERREVVFRAFETTSKPDPILGEGTGLGLKVVRDITDSYGGIAQFIEIDQFRSQEIEWRTCIEVVFPRKER
jgi:signal transduction histidine kinase